MYEFIRITFGENSWLLAIATVAFFTIKGLLWILVPMIAFRWKRWFFRASHLVVRKP